MGDDTKWIVLAKSKERPPTLFEFGFCNVVDAHEKAEKLARAGYENVRLLRVIAACQLCSTVEWKDA